MSWYANWVLGWPLPENRAASEPPCNGEPTASSWPALVDQPAAPPSKPPLASNSEAPADCPPASTRAAINPKLSSAGRIKGRRLNGGCALAPFYGALRAGG